MSPCRCGPERTGTVISAIVWSGTVMLCRPRTSRNVAVVILISFACEQFFFELCDVDGYACVAGAFLFHGGHLDDPGVVCDHAGVGECVEHGAAEFVEIRFHGPPLHRIIR